jgi:hypothetical protein
MGYGRIREGNISAVFRELSLENQSVLLACARLARKAERAGGKASGKGGPKTKIPAGSELVPPPESPV